MVPKRPDGQQRPCDTVPAGTWPDGPLSEDAAVRYVQLIARALHAHLTTTSLRAFSRAAAMSPTTVVAIRDGTRYPDVLSLARLELAAGTPLIPPWETRKVSGE